MAEKTFFLTETMVSTSDKIICVTYTTVSVDETMVFANEKIFSSGVTMLLVKEKIFSVAVTVFFANQKILSSWKRSFRSRKRSFRSRSLLSEVIAIRLMPNKLARCPILTMVFVVVKIFSVTEKIFLVTEKIFSMIEKIFRRLRQSSPFRRPWSPAFGRSSQSSKQFPPSSRPWSLRRRTSYWPWTTFSQGRRASSPSLRPWSSAFRRSSQSFKLGTLTGSAQWLVPQNSITPMCRTAQRPRFSTKSGMPRFSWHCHSRSIGTFYAPGDFVTVFAFDNGDIVLALKINPEHCAVAEIAS